MASEILTLSGQQQALYAALIEKERRLAFMYYGLLSYLGTMTILIDWRWRRMGCVSLWKNYLVTLTCLQSSNRKQ